MAHKHTVYDTDSHFTIDPKTRAITTSGKIAIIQNDHNSERLTFELPRLVDGHDMSQCDTVRVQYINTGSQGISRGLYAVDDVQLKTDSEDVVLFSWLIGQNATKNAGNLSFLIQFICHGEDGSVEYVWHTAVCSEITVSNGMDNGEVVVDQYADFIGEWVNDIIANALTEAKESGEFNGSDAEVTAENIKNALGYTPISGEADPLMANLPLVVGEDGKVAPVPLSPPGIYGSIIDLSTVEDMTQEWTDGYAVRPSTSNMIASARTSVGTTAAVEPGEEYEFTVYTDPSVSPYSMAFRKADGKTIMGDYTYTIIDNENKVYRVIAPEGAAYAQYTVLTTDKDKAYFKKASPMYKLPWLVVSAENINAEALDVIAERTKEAIKTGSLKYGHSLKKPFDFSGKSMVAFGDSITAGVSSPDLVVVDSYAKRFATMHGMTYTGRAVSGTFILDEETASNSIYKRIAGWTGTADFAIIAGGVNDYYYGKTLGTFADTSDVLSFYGSLRKICEYLTENHPNMTVIFITPVNCTREATDATNSLNDYRNAIFEIATAYGFNVVDGSQLGFPAEEGGFQETMLEDGVHPTAAGHDFYAQNLCGVLL